MRTEGGRVATLVALATLGLIVLLGLRPVGADRILAGYVLALAAIAASALVRRLARRSDDFTPSRFEHAIAWKPDPPSRPPELVRIERDLVLGTTNAGHLHARLLPILREAAAARLGARYQVDLARRPEVARTLLGDEAWELVRPDREPPPDLYGPGLSLRAVRRVVERLESL